MAAVQFQVPYQSVVVNGVPAASAKLYFSTTGTVTPLPSYTTSALNVPHPNPVVATASGRLPDIYLDNTKTYRLRIFDRQGALIDDIDPFIPGTVPAAGALQPYANAAAASATAAAESAADAADVLDQIGDIDTDLILGAAAQAVDAAEVAQNAVGLPSAGAKSAKWSGALGNGTTNDSTALQAWLDQGGHLYLPAGEYYSASDLILRKHAIIEGASYGFDIRLATVEDMPGSRIRFANGKGFKALNQTTLTTVAAVTAAGFGAWTQEGAMHSRIANLALIGSGSGSAATGFYATTLVHLDNVHCINFTGKGFDISASADADDGNSEYGNASTSTLKSCKAFQNGSHGFHIRGRDANVIKLDTCNAQLNGGWGFLDDGLLGNAYDNCHAATNTSGSYKASGSVADHIYTGCYVESGTGSNCYIGSRCVITGGNLSESMNGGNDASGPATAIGPLKMAVNQVKFQWTWDNPAAISGYALAYRHGNYGLVIQGESGAGACDVSLANRAGQIAAYVPSSSTNWRVVGYSGSDTGFLLQGTGAWPGLTAGSAPGIVYAHTSAGLVLGGIGSATDVVIANRAGSSVMSVPTGTVTANFYGAISLNGTTVINSDGIKVPKVQSVTSAATVTPTFADDQVNITAQAAGLTLANPSGTAIPAWGVVIRIKDNGTARTIAYGSKYRAIGVTLPTTTVINKTLYLGAVYNSTDDKIDVVAVAQEA